MVLLTFPPPPFADRLKDTFTTTDPTFGSFTVTEQKYVFCASPEGLPKSVRETPPLTPATRVLPESAAEIPALEQFASGVTVTVPPVLLVTDTDCCAMVDVPAVPVNATELDETLKPLFVPVPPT